MSRQCVRYVRLAAIGAAAGARPSEPIAHSGRLLPARMRIWHALPPGGRAARGQLAAGKRRNGQTSSGPAKPLALAAQ